MSDATSIFASCVCLEQTFTIREQPSAFWMITNDPVLPFQDRCQLTRFMNRWCQNATLFCTRQPQDQDRQTAFLDQNCNPRWWFETVTLSRSGTGDKNRPTLCGWKLCTKCLWSALREPIRANVITRMAPLLVVPRVQPGVLDVKGAPPNTTVLHEPCANTSDRGGKGCLWRMVFDDLRRADQGQGSKTAWAQDECGQLQLFEMDLLILGA
ncbi:hypothetical protein QBC37DRAFT_153353 [Rhypophila decipiens]|uniref:Uncharacterized protein n=1 Tax=Rhypophila decipiens TaxID=261697 RepID=A0AAN6YJK2_9PEZI|nr:hypothetical protein QBC37DRAFT_153353 [Rhypophila decipiens]